MGKRSDLQAILEELAGEEVVVYFQPPEDIQMTFPCVVYGRDYAAAKRANNSTYSFTQRYELTLMDHRPDNPLIEKIARLPMATYVRHFEAEQLHHDLFNIYF